MIPLPFRWDGESMVPLHPRRADEQYVIGEVYALEPLEDAESSDRTRNHQFAWLRSAWETLPEHLAVQYPSEKHLRKKALIATGFCRITDYPCHSRAEAARLAKTLQAELDDYTVVMVLDGLVRVARAKSQSRKSMKKDEFQRSKEAVLQWVAALLDVAPEDLQRQGAGGVSSPIRAAA